MNKRETKSCSICSREISLSNISKHEKACIKPKKIRYVTNPNNLNCCFCNKIFRSINAKCQHEIRCKLNINSTYKFTCGISRMHFIPNTPCQYCNKICTDTSSLKNHERRCKDNPKRSLNPMTPKGRIVHNKKGKANSLIRWADPSSREKQSQSMQLAVEKYPNSYSSGNSNRRVKSIIYKDITLQGTWELDFYKWCERENIDCVRTPGWFHYVHEGKKRKYFPDFYLPELDLYIEVKGRRTDVDLSKWNQFPHKLSIIECEEIKIIRKNEFLDVQGYIWARSLVVKAGTS